MNTKKKLTQIVVGLLAAVIVAAMWGAVTACAHETWSLVKRLHPIMLLATFGLCVVYRVVNAAGWTLSLRSLGSDLRVTTGARIWLASESCRWLPGSVWAYGSRAVLARKEGISVQTAAAATALELVLTLLAWTMIAATACIDANSRSTLLGLIPGSVTTVACMLLAGVAVGLVLWRLRPAWLVRQLDRFSGLRVAQFSLRGVCTNLGFFVAANAFNGLIVVWLLQQGLDVRVPVLLVVSANAVAWLVGFFAVFAPGGLVVREAALAAVLATFLPPVDAIAIATLIRGLHLLSEMACLPLLIVGSERTAIASQPEPAVQ